MKTFKAIANVVIKGCSTVERFMSAADNVAAMAEQMTGAALKEMQVEAEAELQALTASLNGLPAPTTADKQAA